MAARAQRKPGGGHAGVRSCRVESPVLVPLPPIETGSDQGALRCLDQGLASCTRPCLALSWAADLPLPFPAEVGGSAQAGPAGGMTSRLPAPSILFSQRPRGGQGEASRGQGVGGNPTRPWEEGAAWDLGAAPCPLQVGGPPPWLASQPGGPIPAFPTGDSGPKLQAAHLASESRSGA